MSRIFKPSSNHQRNVEPKATEPRDYGNNHINSHRSASPNTSTSESSSPSVVSPSAPPVPAANNSENDFSRSKKTVFPILYSLIHTPLFIFLNVAVIILQIAIYLRKPVYYEMNSGFWVRFVKKNVVNLYLRKILS